MEEKKIKTIPLDNGHTLNLFDISKQMGGDRWNVVILGRIDFALNAVFDRHDVEPDIREDMKAVLGDSIRFELKRERFFVDERAKDDVLNTVIDTLLNTGLTYFSHPDFPIRYAQKMYNERKKQPPGYSIRG